MADKSLKISNGMPHLKPHRKHRIDAFASYIAILPWFNIDLLHKLYINIFIEHYEEDALILEEHSPYELRSITCADVIHSPFVTRIDYNVFTIEKELRGSLREEMYENTETLKKVGEFMVAYTEECRQHFLGIQYREVQRIEGKVIIDPIGAANQISTHISNQLSQEENSSLKEKTVEYYLSILDQNETKEGYSELINFLKGTKDWIQGKEEEALEKFKTLKDYTDSEGAFISVKLPEEIQKQILANFETKHHQELLHKAERCLCRVEYQESGIMGHGILLEDGYLLTSNHLIPSQEQAQQIQIVFNKNVAMPNGGIVLVKFQLDPSTFFYTNPAIDFDYTIVKIKEDLPFSLDNVLSMTKGQQGDQIFAIQFNTDHTIYKSNGIIFDQPDKYLFQDLNLPDGASGAPIMDANGTILAMISRIQQDQQMVHAISIVDIREDLKANDINPDKISMESPSDYTPDLFKTDKDTAINIYISAAREDLGFKNEVEIHLAKLNSSVKGFNIKLFSSQDITNDEQWDQAIQRKISESDIILLLVSPAFLSSRYIVDKEVDMVMQRYEQREALVIPIILKPCNWKNMSFAKLQTLPNDAISPSRRRKRKVSPYLNLIQGVREAIATSLKRKGIRTESKKPEFKFNDVFAIYKILSKEKNLTKEENPIAGILIYETKTQQTWIVRTPSHLYFVLDDEKTRKKDKLVRVEIGIREARDNKIKINNSKNTIAIGRSRRTPWLYSSRRFPSKEDLMSKVEEIINLDPSSSEKKDTIKGALTLIPRPANVISRTHIVKSIGEALKNKNNIILISGLSGMGKTTIALEYIWQQDSFDKVIWIEVTDKITEAFINNTLLKESLKVNEALNKIAPQERYTQGFEIIMNEMSELPGNNLLVIDNVNNVDDLMSHMDTFQKLQWKVLLTSRIHSSSLGNDLHSIIIGELPMTDALHLFHQYFPFEDHQQIIVEELINKLYVNTLVIELVARTGSSQKFSLEALAKMVNNIYDRILGLKSTSTDKKTSEIEYLSIYIENILSEVTILSETEEQYLRYLCLLPPYDYTESMFIDLFEIDEETNQNFKELLKNLAEKAVLSNKQAKEGKIYKLHPLIQSTLIKKLIPDSENCSLILDVFTDKLYIDESKDNPVEKFQWLAYGESILKRIQGPKSKAICNLQFNLAVVIIYSGDYYRSRNLLETLLNTSLELFKEDHQLIAKTRSMLAQVYRELGEYAKAKDLFEKTLVSSIENWGEEHPNTTLIQSNLATVYRNIGDLEEARKLLEKSLASDIKNVGEEHPKIAVHQSNLAFVYRDMGDLEKARDLFKKSLVIDRTVFGEKHPKIAVHQSNLASVYTKMGLYKEAQELLEKALISNLENFGEKHPNLISMYINLGAIYNDLGNQSTAKNYFQKGHGLSNELLGEKHPTTKNAKQWLDRFF